ncbi:MAG: Oligogalacturonate lyase [bacterium ADurb.Bin429]|nr:MAG: Oligogalacturonate lyase [bacterium ADurb.Bin429]
MTTGTTWPVELTIATDPVSGATVRQLTRYKAHSHHAYFTYSCWYDDGRKLVIASDRGNRTNLYGVDLESGEFTQLTDWEPGTGADTHGICKNPAREEIYITIGGTVTALDLTTLRTRPLYSRPAGYVNAGMDVTADGRYLCVGCTENLSDRFQVDLGHGYIGFNEYWEAHPHSMIWRVPVDGGATELVHEERCWVGHVNASPRLPHLITFCHEGPWHKVGNRIWGLDLTTGSAWKIRPTAPGETVGHEYWMTDGEHIGYHGGNADGGIYGAIRYDNTDRTEAPFVGHCWHFHSHLLDLVVGDGNAREPYLLAWRFRDGAFEGPKVLAWHRGSFHTQALHVHPHVFAGGTKVLYTADPHGYGQVTIVDVPEFEALPNRSEVTKNKEV